MQSGLEEQQRPGTRKYCQNAKALHHEEHEELEATLTLPGYVD
jgi:hypothetical protein